MGDRRVAPGLTLVELLVALTVLSLIVVVLTSLFRFGVVGAERIDGRVDRLDQTRHAQAFLRQAIEAARPVRWGADQRVRAAFEGDERELRFIGVLPPWPGRGGLYQFRLRQEQDRLLIDRVPTAGETEGFSFSAATEAETLGRGIASVRLSYFGRDPRTRERGWSAAWRDRGDLPELVRIDVDFVDRRGPMWPTLAIHPYIDPAPR